MGRKKKEKEENKSAFDLLSDKHKLFVKEYIRNFAVAYKAYKYIHPKVKDSTAMVEASKLLRKPNVRQAIEDEYKRIWAEKDTEIEKSKTYQMIHVIGNSDISDVVDLENGTLEVKDLKDIPSEARQCIQAIEYIEKETQHGVDRNIKVKLHSKLPALELRAKIQKMIDKDNPQPIEIIINPAKRPEKEKEE